ncbi:endopeptidase La, partial [Elusimicrobiota bacterium]
VLFKFKKYVHLNPAIDMASYAILEEISKPDKLADIILSHLKLKKEDVQVLLEEFDPIIRIKKISDMLDSELEILEIRNEIEGQINLQFSEKEKQQFVSQQMKAIKRELSGKEEENEEIEGFRKKLAKSALPDEARASAEKELNRMEKMMPYSPEATVVRTYLDWILKLPWKEKTKDRLDVKKAGKILEDEHYGLKEAKERILEYLAVSKLSKRLKTPILCFVGPPGTGKTSFGKSIANSLGRKFTRFSLGGVRDEAEIRGHRRTYIGSLPGRIIQSIAKVGTKNPVFLLDEVDKIGKDFRGDPSSALLEALDSEQNHEFSDNYLEVNFDLSDVMFITTANSVATIPPAMLDRMEVIEFPGYTLEEKTMIAQKFIISKQLNENGLKKYNVGFTKGSIEAIISNYTREAGVRNLERKIAKILRVIAKRLATGKNEAYKITSKAMYRYLGVPPYSSCRSCYNGIGIASGLSWTQNGGESLSIEVSLMPGTGKLKLTGTLGDVMKESAQTAVSYMRSICGEFDVTENFYKNRDIHIHVPAGAIPKEGPSAGITICTALLSELKNKAVKNDVAMTGEITLNGKILEIGGFKEKILAAYRDGYRKVIFPADNEKNIIELPSNIKRKLKLIPVSDFREVIEHVF